jgi:hypothetical protein
MKILIICSKAFYGKVPLIKIELERMGHTVFLPNCIDDPTQEEKARTGGIKTHSKFKAKMFRQSLDCIKNMDAVLTLNYDKNGDSNYIGGATFLELYEAFMNGKKIFLLNDIPQGILYDEICGMSPIVIHGNLANVK